MKQIIKAFAILASLCCLAISAPAQTLGFEGGYSRNSQMGKLDGGCGCEEFSDGAGDGMVFAVSFSMPLMPSVQIGGFFGIDSRKIKMSRQSSEFMVFQTVENSKEIMDTSTLPMRRDAEVTTSYLTIAPTITYCPLEVGPFLRVAPAVSLLVSDHIQETRTLTSNSAKLRDGTAVNNLRFTNGTTEEKLQDAPIKEAHSVRYSLNLGAGYDISFGNIAISPMVIYDYPLNTISDKNAEDFKISSVYGVVGLKLKLR